MVVDLKQQQYRLHLCYLFNMQIINHIFEPLSEANQKMRLTLLLLLSLLPMSFVAQNQAIEVRAVWLTTNWELDMPSSRLSEANQKKEIISTLDDLSRMNINTILFQVRIRGDVFYKSSIEPFSPHYKWSKNSDILDFMIEECHKRGIECHAWFVVYPLGSKKHVQKQRESIANRRPNLCKLHKGEWYLDPGNPETRKYLLSLVDEVVSKYDIDGIHFDYIRYPDDSSNFPDKDTFQKYGKGLKLEDWRRNNITQFVESAYNLTKNKKPWVLVSSSPIGKYKNINLNKNEWTGYDNVYQDAGLWMKKGIHDAIFPMLYHKEKEFDNYLYQWTENRNGRILVPGIGIYRLDSKEGNWTTSEIDRQIKVSRDLDTQGQIFYRLRNLTDNLRGVKESIVKEYKYPAKLPPLVWLSNDLPLPLVDFEVFRTDNNLICIRWQPSEPSANLSYTVYVSRKDEFDLTKAEHIIVTRFKGNEIFIKPEEFDEGLYYSVTATDRFLNESEIISSAFFVYSDLIK